MRKYTFVVSVVVHLAAVVAVLVAPLLATAPLPVVRDATTWVQAVVTTVPPPAARQRPRSQAAAPRPAIPVVAPRGIDPEPETPPVVEAFGGLDEIGNGTVPGGLLPGAIGTGTAHAPPPPSLPPLVRARTPVRPGGALERPRRIVDVAPIYPKLALAVRREGVVILEALIDEDGSVREVTVLRSVPLLDEAAVDAVRQWRFTPTTLNGERVPVVMNVTVTFQLR